MATSEAATPRLRELGVDDVWVLLPLVLLDPHLQSVSAPHHLLRRRMMKSLTFLKVLRPARMLPPVHVV